MRMGVMPLDLLMRSTASLALGQSTVIGELAVDEVAAKVEVTHSCTRVDEVGGNKVMESAILANDSSVSKAAPFGKANAPKSSGNEASE